LKRDEFQLTRTDTSNIKDTRRMRRIRKDATKVWHNPEINTSSRRGSNGGGPTRPPRESVEDRRAVTQHRAALEALFAPRRDPESEGDGQAKANGRTAREGAPKGVGRIVLPPPPKDDPRTTERQKLLSKLLLAQGRPNVSKAADEFVRAGFNFPDDQDVHLQLLEHVNEDHVRSAIDALTSLLAGELPKRRAVLDSRLRRIEQFAEEVSTRDAAARLRRSVSGRAGTPSTPPGPQ
jgi:hypothetical protein